MKNEIRITSLIIGSLLSVVIVCSQFFQFQIKSNHPEKQAKTEQQESKTPSEQVVLSLPSFSLPSSIQVALNLDAYCLFEILFEENETADSSTDSPLYPKKFFITLFRVIISPNAP
jgi:hypothetical protein